MLSKQQLRKAGGDSGVILEMLVFGAPVLHIILLARGCGVKVWCLLPGEMPWLFPCPRNMCSNWRGISLLDVAGKLLGWIVQERLQCIVESVLSDSQCGFRWGQGCSDMIFVARQLVEKTRKHNSLLSVLDLKMAYDSVSDAALWQVLKKFGIPPVFVGHDLFLS